MKDLKYFNTFLDYYNKLINKFKSNINNEVCTIIEENPNTQLAPKRDNPTNTITKDITKDIKDTNSEENSNKIGSVTNFKDLNTNTNKDTNGVGLVTNGVGLVTNGVDFGDVEPDTVTEEIEELENEFIGLKIRDEEIEKLNEILENYHKKDEKLLKRLKKLKCSNKEYDYFPKLGDKDHDIWDLKTPTYDIDINYIHILFFNHYNIHLNNKINKFYHRNGVDGIYDGNGVDGIYDGNGVDGIYEIDRVDGINVIGIEEMIMKSINNINEMEEILIDKFGIEITKTNINCLFNDNWINDEIINFYLQLLQNHNRI